MSLGWNTESALVPSQSKEIKGVTSASMLALKASVSKASSESVVWHRSQSHAKKKKRRLEPTNPGVEERRLLGDAVEDRSEVSGAKLRAKALVYDALAERGTETDDDVLVDFRQREKKTRQDVHPWAWSTARETNHCDVAALLEDAKRKTKKKPERSTADVKSMWDRGLSAADKKILEGVNDDTIEGRKQTTARALDRDKKRKHLEAKLLRHSSASSSFLHK